MKHALIIAGVATLALAGAATAQTTSSGTPTQGSPPMTNTPVPAASDSSMPSDMSMTNGSMTAPVTKPMAGTGTTATDDTTMTHKSHKKTKKPHG